MKKLIGIGIAAMMVMGLAGAASAAENNWTVLLKAGNLSGTTWVGSGATFEFGVSSTAKAPAYTAAFTQTTVGFFGVNPDPNRMANKDYRLFNADVKEYTWNVKFKVGDSWNPDTAFNFYYASPAAIPGDPWKLTLSNGTTSYELKNPATNGGTAAHFYAFANGMKMNPGEQNWTLTATAVPEPGSIVAMLSGLVGLAGFGIRRRK